MRTILSLVTSSLVFSSSAYALSVAMPLNCDERVTAGMKMYMDGAQLAAKPSTRPMAIMQMESGAALVVSGRECQKANLAANNCSSMMLLGENMMADGHKLNSNKYAQKGSSLLATGNALYDQGKSCQQTPPTTTPVTDCKTALEAGKKMVEQGTKQLQNTATVPIGTALIAAGQKLIANASTCQINKENEGWMANEKNCRAIKGNWYAQGNYCYIVNSQRETASNKKDKKQIEKCEESGKSWNPVNKTCFHVHVNPASVCNEQGQVPLLVGIVSSGQSTFSCVNVNDVKCAAYKNKKQKEWPLGCDPSRVPASLKGSFVTGVKPVSIPVQLPQITNVSTSTATYTAANGHTITATSIATSTASSTTVPHVHNTTSTSTVTYTMANGHTIVSTVVMVNTQLSTSNSLSTATSSSTGGDWGVADLNEEKIEALVGLGYDSQTDCMEKLDRLNSIEGASVMVDQEDGSFARYCGAFDYSMFAENQERREDRILYKMKFKDYGSCTRRWQAALDVPTIQIKFAGFDFNAKAEKVCKRLFPNDGAPIALSGYSLSYTYRDKPSAERLVPKKGSGVANSNQDQRAWGVADPIAASSNNVLQSVINLRATEECQAISEAQHVAKNVSSFLPADHFSKIDIIGYAVMRPHASGSIGVCRLGKMEQKDYDKLPNCKPCAASLVE